MKKLTIFFAGCLMSFSLMAQCDFYMPLKVNGGIEMQQFNPKNKLTGTTTTKILAINSVGTSQVADLQAISVDDKGKQVADMKYQVTCNGSEISIEIKSLIDPKTFEGFQGMEMKMESENMEIPSNLTVGSTLKDAKMKMNVMMNGSPFTEMNFLFTNRTVEAKESITCPAGTFDCYKISYEIQTATKMMGFTTNITSKTIEYYAKNVGVVKQEIYDQKGKLQSYSLLSKVF